MKKILLSTFLTAAIAVCTNAQTINAKYEYPGKMARGNNIAVVNSQDGAPMFAYLNSFEIDMSTSAWTTKTTQIDANTGAFIKAIERPSDNIDRVMATSDQNVLMVSLLGQNMVATKYDQNLNQMWAVEVPHAGHHYHRQWVYIDIEPVSYPNPSPDEPPIEEYFIVYTVVSHLEPNGPEYTTKVVRLNNMGQVVWAKTYDTQNRIPNNFNDYACSITSFPDDEHGRLFAIAGARNTAASDPSIFSFLIDEQGNMISQFTTFYPAGGDLQLPDIVYDSKSDSLVIVYTQEPGGIYPNSVASGMSVLKVDKYLNNGRGRYFWHDCENWANSISILSTGEYIIGGFTSACQSTASQYGMTGTFLKLDQNLNKQIYMRYDPLRDPGQNYSMHTTDKYDYNYLLVDVPNKLSVWPYTWLSTDKKLIKADANLRACGAVEFDVDQLNFEVDVAQEAYEVYDWSPEQPTTIPVAQATPNYIVCADAGRKSTGVVNRTSDKVSVSINPTLIRHRSGEPITCKIDGIENDKVQVVVYNQLGQIVNHQSYLITGNTAISMDASNLASGINIVRILANNKVVATEKVSVIN